MPSVYPKNLGYVVHRLVGYHRNQIQIIPSTSSAQVAPNGVIMVNLPENTILDLATFRLVIPELLSSAGLAASVGGEPGVKSCLPFAQAMIQRVDISINGTMITNGLSEYNTAFRLMRNVRVTGDKNATIDCALQNSFPDISNDTVTTITNWNGAANQVAVSNNLVNGGAVAQNIPVIICDWLGFLDKSGCSVRFLDTGLVGQITIKITLADTNVLMNKVNLAALGNVNGSLPTFSATQAALAATNNYLLKNVYATINAVSINDGVYDMALRKTLEAGRTLELNFDEFYNFVQPGLTSGQQSIRFALSSQSINKIYGTFRHDSYISRGMPAVKYDPSSLYNEGFQPSYFNFRSFATDGSFRWQYSVNSVNRPNYLAAEIEALGGVLNSENKLGTEAVTGNQIFSFQEFRNNKFAAGIRLNHPIDGENRTNWVSGFDSRGVSAQMLWNVQGMTVPSITPPGGSAITTACAYVLVNTTSTLKIGAGRQLMIIN